MATLAPLLLPFLPADTNVRSFIIYALFEALAIGAVFVLLTWYRRDFKFIGLNRFKSDFILNAALGFAVYFALSYLILVLVSAFITLPTDQQATGFTQPNGLDLVLAFVTLVMIVPVAEEMLFRGFIFKGIRSAFSFPVTALAVSVLFAVAHGQLSVGLDVFALSLVLCYLREKSDSLWPGILLHGLKNAVAFVTLFIYNGH